MCISYVGHQAMKYHNISLELRKKKHKNESNRNHECAFIWFHNSNARPLNAYLSKQTNTNAELKALKTCFKKRDVGEFYGFFVMNENYLNHLLVK